MKNMSILKSRYSTPEVPKDTTLIDIILEKALKNGDQLALVSILLRALWQVVIDN